MLLKWYIPSFIILKTLQTWSLKYVQSFVFRSSYEQGILLLNFALSIKTNKRKS